MVKEFNADGQLSKYALSCGYVQSFVKNEYRIELYQEHACYHVRMFYENTNEFKRLMWESSFSLTEARNIFNNARKQISRK